MKRIALTLLTLILLISCSQDKHQEYSERVVDEGYYGGRTEMAMDAPAVEASAMMSKRSTGSNSLMQDQSSEQKIIKSANLRYEVFNLDSSLLLISNTLSEYNGIVQNERQYDSGNRKYTSLTLRIPSKHFNNFINALMDKDNIRKLEDKSISAQDVTEQFVDIESRLETKNLALSRYREILQKANTVKDIMTVEDKIRRLQEEIESQEARLKYLSHQVDMSEVRINIYQVVPVTYIPNKPESFGAKFLRSLDRGLDGIGNVFFWVIGYWPIWLLIIAILIFFRSRRKKKE